MMATKETKKVRIATCNATGSRYIVNVVECPKNGENIVRCWGNVVAFRGMHATHERQGAAYRASAVTVTEVERTPALLLSLFNQTIAARRAAGHVVTVTRKGNATDHGKPAEIATVR